MAIFFNIAKDMPLHVVKRQKIAERAWLGVDRKAPGRVLGLASYCGEDVSMGAVRTLSSVTYGGAVCEACIHELVRRDKERKGSLWPYCSSTMA